MTMGRLHHVLVECDKTIRMVARKVSRSIFLNIGLRKAQRFTGKINGSHKC